MSLHDHPFASFTVHPDIFTPEKVRADCKCGWHGPWHPRDRENIQQAAREDHWAHVYEVAPPVRVQLRRTKGWRKPKGAVVVSRPSKWGNPYPRAEYERYYSADEIPQLMVSDFRGLVEGRWDRFDPPAYPSIEVIQAELRGHDLACWCPLDAACHADVLLELANR